MSSSAVGLILLDSALNPITSNQEALRILAFPTNPESIDRIDLFLRDKVQANLIQARKAPTDPTFVAQFGSGNRRYFCTAFSVEAHLSGPSNPAVVLLLERNAQPFLDMSRLAARFHLTPRERETVEYLLQGLPTKTIARRMKVSPSTVNAFLRMVMVKVGATSRSGVIGKFVHPNPKIPNN
ncbi:MAG TPA: helix-turn-helix transcriptional regulator [Terriglobales bacterium]|nr:helix-turn-helix transcriptional regulator [Terriglobales bacterium]